LVGFWRAAGNGLDSVNFATMNQVSSLKRQQQVKAFENFVLEVKVY
jgi:hypothetical protein